ncbi:MAG: sulfatase/phosphatase domain-containing protein [Bryobacteraceae bacterium]
MLGIVPTLMELLGKKVPESLPGESLLPMIKGGALRDDHVYIEWHTPPNGQNGRTVISPGGSKLALYDADNCLLFEPSNDPLEGENLYYGPESKPRIRRLRKRIESWQKRVADRQALPEA